MEKNSKNYFRFAIEMSILTLAFTVLLKKYDVQPVGPNGSSVGLSAVNSFLAGVFDYNEKWYGITNFLGYVAIGVCLIFALIGLIQLIQRKSLAKVDRAITVMGVFYIVVFGLYVFFNKFALNYRPVLLEEGLEPSFPSSHTLLVCSVMGMAIVAFDTVIKNLGLRVIADLACWAAILIMIVGRILSGVHWFTDIFAGILFSLTIVSYYHAIVLMQESED